MFSRQLLRTTARSLQSISPRPIQSVSPTTRTRPFHSTPAIMVQAGDSIPDVPLVEGSPGDKIDLSQELASGKGLIIGVPAAFSPGCSDHHIPGYMMSENLKDAGQVFVVSVNDAFVMKAWAKSLDTDKSSGIRFLGDPSGAFTRAWDVEFDAAAILGNNRSKRYAVVTQDGKVKSAHVEPDNTGISVSAADKVLA